MNFNNTSSQKIRKHGFDTQQVFNPVNEFVIVSESEGSSETPYCHTFSTSLMDIFKLIRVEGDGNCLFIALWMSTFGDNSMHLMIRQHVCDYIIQHSAKFKDFMEDNEKINDYIARCYLMMNEAAMLRNVAF